MDFIASSDTLDRYHEIIDAAGWRLDNYRRNPVFQNAHNYGDIIFTIGKALITEIRQGPLPNAASGPLSTLNSQPSAYLFQRIQFATDVNPMARIAHGLYRGGYLSAVSVGFIPLRWENADGSQWSTLSGSPRPIGLGEGSGVRAPSGASICIPHSELPTPHSEGSAFRTPNSELRTPSFRRKYLEQELLEVSAVGIPANPDALALGLKSGAVAQSDLRELADLCSRSLQAAPVGSQLSTFNPQLISLARALRDLLRRS